MPEVGSEVSLSELRGEVWAESCTLPTTLARWYLRSGHGRESRERREKFSWQFEEAKLSLEEP